MKILNIILVVILFLAILVIAGYFSAGYFLNKYLGPEYLFVHPTIAKFFNVTAVCPLVCPQGGVCGRDGKNYCNSCLALKSGTSFAYNGACNIFYKNTEYGFTMAFPATWKGFIYQKKTWEGRLINKQSNKPDYTGVELLFKNPQTTPTQPWQDIPIMIFTPDVWARVSGNNPTIAVSAAPIGPEKISENSKYVFATPPRWYGFTSAIGFQEAVDIVKTFKAF